MSKRRFEIVETELPKARILDKFTVGNEEPEVASEELGNDTALPKGDEIGSSSIASNDAPVIVEDSLPKPRLKNSDNKKDTLAATSVVTRAAPPEDPQDDVSFPVNFKVGIPVSLVAQYNELKAKSTLSEDYLTNWLFSRSFKIMDTINVAEIEIPLEGPKTVDPILSKRLYAKKSQLDRFRKHHDPLEVYKIVDCCRLIYAASFKEALAELSAKLEI